MADETPEEIEARLKAEQDKKKDGDDDLAGLKSALASERQARKDAEKKNKDFETKQEELERKALEEKGNFEKLYNDGQEKLTALQTQIKEKDIDSALKSIANSITKDGNKRDDITALYKSHAQHTENGVVFTHSGIECTKEQLIDRIKADRPYLVDGSQASGGGASGGSGGATGKTMKREAFQTLPPHEQSKFVLEGGTLTE